MNILGYHRVSPITQKSYQKQILRKVCYPKQFQGITFFPFKIIKMIPTRYRSKIYNMRAHARTYTGAEKGITNHIIEFKGQSCVIRDTHAIAQLQIS